MNLYRTAKTLDPGRLVSTSDGIGDDGTSNHSNPYDFLTPGYEGGAMPLDNSHLYRPGNVSDRKFNSSAVACDASFTLTDCLCGCRSISAGL